MDELHAANADYLRRQRRPLSREEAAATALLGGPVSRCRVCGAPVNDHEDGLYNLAAMQAVRACREHYAPFR